MELTEETVIELAQICRLALTQEETRKYCRDLAALQTLASALLPLSGAQTDCEENDAPELLREDVCRPFAARDELLRSAPRLEEGCLVVPRAVEEVSE